MREEKTHDIWNDDDGEAAEQQARKSRRRRFLTFFLVLAAVLLVVLAAAWRDGTGLDILRRTFSYGDQAAEGETVYEYDTSSQNRFAALGDRLVVLSATKLQILDPVDGEIWSTAVSMSAPALVQSGNRAVAYDIGGTELYVLGEAGELLHLSAQGTEPLIAANLNEADWLAVTTQKAAYKGCVTVYDPELERVYEFNSSQRFVTDACVTDNGKYLAAVTLGQEAGTFVSNVVIYDLSKEDPEAEYDVTDGLAAAITDRDGQLVTVSDTCLTMASTKGEVEATYAYNGAYLRDYSLDGDGFTPLLLNRYRSGSVGRLVTVNEKGEKIASLDVSEEVLDLSAAGRYLAVLYGDSLVVYNQDLEVYATYEGTDYASGVLVRSDGSALLMTGDSASLFLP